MKSPLYSRVRRYTYLVILTLTVSFSIAAGTFLYYEIRIQSELDRGVNFHARTAQLAGSIKEELLPLRSLLEAHHVLESGHHEAAPSDVEMVLSSMPIALYNINKAFEIIRDLQQTYGGSHYELTIGKINGEIAELARTSAESGSSEKLVEMAEFETSLSALMLSADQLRRLHLIAGENLGKSIHALTEERDLLLASLVSVIAVLAITTLVYLVSQIRVAFLRQEEADRVLVEREKRYRTLVNTLPNGILEVDLDGTIVLVNDAYAQMLGAPKSEIVGEKVWTFLSDEETKRGLKDRLPTMIQQEPSLPPITTKQLRKDGEAADVEISWAHERDAAGKPLGLIAVVSDVTARLRLEERLRQSQKLEAIGQLTGGVAHEFNNLLGVIQGNAELLTDDEVSGSSFTDPILRATARGAELTKHLLSFARKQPLNPRVIDLTQLINGMSQMLGQTLGEDIEIVIATEPSLSAVSADPSQLETALLNLIINARDAMPSGGTLRIECKNVEAGDGDGSGALEHGADGYVLITVSDTGTGMSGQVLSHAFEPFYTTKEVGKGTGLGLAMVYGFAEQSGGHVSIDSKEGEGTIVRLYLPRHHATVPKAAAQDRAEVPRGRGEAVLVIEDDREMRVLAVNMLKGLGYQTSDVPEAASARAALARGESFDAVLSDIVLPGGVNGIEFAEELNALDPDFKVIFMSGYPADTAKRNCAIGPDRILLNKPFTRRELAEALRSVLD